MPVGGQRIPPPEELSRVRALASMGSSDDSAKLRFVGVHSWKYGSELSQRAGRRNLELR
jgi:hypothetical protein